MFKSLFNENQLIGPQKYTFTGSKSSQNASIFHEKNDGGVKFFIGYPYTAGYGGIQEYCCPYFLVINWGTHEFSGLKRFGNFTI